MAVKPYEIPTHLNVEDKVFFGLAARQVMVLIAGCSGSYALWNQWPDIPIGLRLCLAGACLLIGLIVALMRPAGRPLEDWSIVLLQYVATPKTSVWYPREPDRADRSSDGDGWEDFTPQLAWPGLSETEECR